LVILITIQLDRTNPNKESNTYLGIIDISETTIIKIIGYNKKDEMTDKFILKYIIDKKY